jgi:nitroreductase
MFDILAKTRQSCRSYTGEMPPREVLERILDTALLAPSACNSQPWHLYLVTDPEKVGAVCESLQDHGMNKFLSDAPAFVVVTEKCATLRPNSRLKYSGGHFVKYDIGEMVAYLTLAAESHGVDSCIIGWINEDKLRAAVGYPAEESCNIVVALGYGTDDTTRDKVRRAKEETVTYL